MQQIVTALLVHGGEACFQILETVLGRQGIRTSRAHSCAEASTWLAEHDAPQLVFTYTRFCDGTWADVLNLASELRIHDFTKIIVVSRVVDYHVYLDSIEKGAFDFIVPPFQPEDLAFIVRSALWSAQEKGSQPKAPDGRQPRQQKSQAMNAGGAQSQRS
jgi:DNA-binding NtrC family response regulator